jgi:hypothetical protein
VLSRTVLSHSVRQFYQVDLLNVTKIVRISSHVPPAKNTAASTPAGEHTATTLMQQLPQLDLKSHKVRHHPLLQDVLLDTQVLGTKRCDDGQTAPDVSKAPNAFTFTVK